MCASLIRNKVLIKTNEEDSARPFSEAVANVAITPGELLEVLTDGELDPHGTADGVAQKIWAEVNQLDGDRTISALDTDYAIGDTVYHHYAQAGDEINAFVAASVVLVKGVTRLASDGAGALKIAQAVDATQITTSIVAVAHETITIGGSRGRALVKVV